MLAEDDDAELWEWNRVINYRVQNLSFGKQMKIEVGKKVPKLRVRRKDKNDEKKQNIEKKEKSSEKAIHDKGRGISHLLDLSDSDYSV